MAAMAIHVKQQEHLITSTTTTTTTTATTITGAKMTRCQSIDTTCSSPSSASQDSPDALAGLSDNSTSSVADLVVDLSASASTRYTSTNNNNNNQNNNNNRLDKLFTIESLLNNSNKNSDNKLNNNNNNSENIVNRSGNDTRSSSPSSKGACPRGNEPGPEGEDNQSDNKELLIRRLLTQSTPILADKLKQHHSNYQQHLARPNEADQPLEGATQTLYRQPDQPDHDDDNDCEQTSERAIKRRKTHDITPESTSHHKHQKQPSQDQTVPIHRLEFNNNNNHNKMGDDEMDEEEDDDGPSKMQSDMEDNDDEDDADDNDDINNNHHHHQHQSNNNENNADYQNQEQRQRNQPDEQEEFRAIKRRLSSKELNESTFQKWVQRVYGHSSKTKTITREKYNKIVAILMQQQSGEPKSQEAPDLYMTEMLDEGPDQKKQRKRQQTDANGKPNNTITSTKNSSNNNNNNSPCITTNDRWNREELKFRSWVKSKGFLLVRESQIIEDSMNTMLARHAQHQSRRVQQQEQQEQHGTKLSPDSLAAPTSGQLGSVDQISASAPWTQTELGRQSQYGAKETVAPSNDRLVLCVPACSVGGNGRPVRDDRRYPPSHYGTAAQSRPGYTSYHHNQSDLCRNYPESSKYHNNSDQYLMIDQHDQHKLNSNNNNDDKDDCLPLPKQQSKQVAIVEDFFKIISEIHDQIIGRIRFGKHMGQKRTFQAVTDRYAFLPREAVTKFLMSCRHCSRRMRTKNRSSLDTIMYYLRRSHLFAGPNSSDARAEPACALPQIPGPDPQLHHQDLAGQYHRQQQQQLQQHYQRHLNSNHSSSSHTTNSPLSSSSNSPTPPLMSHWHLSAGQQHHQQQQQQHHQRQHPILMPNAAYYHHRGLLDSSSVLNGGASIKMRQDHLPTFMQQFRSNFQNICWNGHSNGVNRLPMGTDGVPIMGVGSSSSPPAGQQQHRLAAYQPGHHHANQCYQPIEDWYSGRDTTDFGLTLAGAAGAAGGGTELKLAPSELPVLDLSGAPHETRSRLAAPIDMLLLQDRLLGHHLLQQDQLSAVSPQGQSSDTDRQSGAPSRSPSLSGRGQHKFLSDYHQNSGSDYQQHAMDRCGPICGHHYMNNEQRPGQDYGLSGAPVVGARAANDVHKCTQQVMDLTNKQPTGYHRSRHHQSQRPFGPDPACTQLSLAPSVAMVHHRFL